MLPEWNPSYSIGNDLLDRQHARLLDLCRHAEQYMTEQGGEAEEQLHELLHQLATYADVHFATEEEVLRKCGYPNLDEQIEGHMAYREELTRMLFEAMDGRLTNRELFDYATGWWLDHILVSDMECAPYLRGEVPESA